MSILGLILTCLWLVYWVVIRFVLLVIVLNIIPLFVLGFLFVCCMYLHAYRAWHDIKMDPDSKVFTSDIFHRARDHVCTFWDLIGKVWFGYEIYGLENVPKEGGAIMAYYHGTIPLDIYLLISKIRLQCHRSVNTVADKFVYKLHGLKLLWRVFAVTTGTREECIQILKDGNLLAIAPGGTREAYFSENYGLMWRQRKGFAQVAMEAKVPIIPFFTKNAREAFLTPKLGRPLLRWLYEKTRGPFVPIYGGFPVKMQTYIGAPIHWEDGMTVDDMVQKSHKALEDLIHTHQTVPGSIRRALMERFKSKEKTA